MKASRNFLLKFDFFSSNYSFSGSSTEKKKSTGIGAFFSIITLVALGLMIYYSGKELVLKEEPMVASDSQLIDFEKGLVLSRENFYFIAASYTNISVLDPEPYLDFVVTLDIATKELPNIPQSVLYSYSARYFEVSDYYLIGARFYLEKCTDQHYNHLEELIR